MTEVLTRRQRDKLGQSNAELTLEAEEIRRKLAEPSPEQRLAEIEAELDERRAAQARAEADRSRRLTVLRDAQQRIQQETLAAAVAFNEKLSAAVEAREALRRAGGSAPDFSVIIAGAGLYSGTEDESAPADWKRSDEGGKSRAEAEALLERREANEEYRVALREIRQRLQGGQW
jgi:hypothetical protein